MGVDVKKKLQVSQVSFDAIGNNVDDDDPLSEFYTVASGEYFNMIYNSYLNETKIFYLDKRGVLKSMNYGGGCLIKFKEVDEIFYK